MEDHPFDSRDLAGICQHCIAQTWRRVPEFKNLGWPEIKDEIRRALKVAIENDHIYQNPKRDDQYLAYACFQERHYWLVLGPNETQRDGAWIVVTLFVHKDKYEYAEYFEDVQRRSGDDVGEVA